MAMFHTFRNPLPARFMSMGKLNMFALTALLTTNAGQAPALADPASAPSAIAASSEPLSEHAQITNTQQYHGSFPAAYSGLQSMADTPDTAKTFDLTLFLGTRLWKNGEFYVNPELDQGFGLGNSDTPDSPYNGTFGAAGFVSGEAYKVGRAVPYMRVQRIFVRQTFNYGDERQKIDPGINQLSGSVTAKHLTLTAGKFSVTDIFDNNIYAHDPKNDFLNWSIIDMGAFDYAADAWGYTYGISAEANTAQTTLRAGVFQLSSTPNNIPIEHTPLRQYSPVVEYEHRTSFFGAHPGAIKALVYANDGYVGSYADAISAAAGSSTPPNTALVRQDKHWKVGAGVNIAQEIASHVGVFTRVNAMNGTYEEDEFTDIDRSLSAGLSIDGGLYHRSDDTFGLAIARNTLSAPAQQYFAAGGLGVLVGDGGLSYASEQVLESYYKVGLAKSAAITIDYQHITNPAYNQVRGPISVYGVRYHVQI